VLLASKTNMLQTYTLAPLPQGNTEEVKLRMSIKLNDQKLTVELFNEEGIPVFIPDMDTRIPGFNDVAASVGQAILRQSRIFKGLYNTNL
jgi:hypothetical protein